MIKYIGLLTASVCIAAVGKYTSYTYRKKHEQLTALAGFVEHISSRIEFYNSTLDDIYRTYSDPRLTEFTASLQSGTELSDALDMLEFAPDAEDMAVLKEFAVTFGRVSREEQLRACAYAKDRLKASCEKSGAALDKKTKLAESLSLLSAVFLLTLFL